MKQLLLAGLALQLCALPALAQTTATPSTMPPASAPSTTTGPGTPARPVTGSPTYSSTTPAVTAPDRSVQTGANAPIGTTTQAAPAGAVRGANSFTQAQARRRLERNGYTQVSGLTKGNDGIWRGTAMKNGSSVQVTVDYKGDISMN